jgi:phosphoribosylformylglycinamidine synthase PurS subunit
MGESDGVTSGIFSLGLAPLWTPRRVATTSAGPMKATVIVMPKQSILDPQGVAVRDALRHHGVPGAKSVRVGKFIELEVDGADEAKLHEIAKDLLSNPVVEDYRLEVER